MNPAVKHMQRLWTHESGMRWYLQSGEDDGFVEMVCWYRNRRIEHCD